MRLNSYAAGTYYVRLKATATHEVGAYAAVTVNPPPLTVTSVTVKTPPTKTTYTAGEQLDLSGLVVTLNKNDSTAEDVTFANFGGKEITDNPANGTTLATANNKVTITYTVSGKSAEQSITVNPPPTYIASVGPTDKTFTAAAVGYGTQKAEQFTITNTGTGQITGLSAALGGSNFEISTVLSGTNINAGGTVTISVRPKTGLSVGSYTDTLTISGNNNISLTVDLSFEVMVAPFEISSAEDLAEIPIKGLNARYIQTADIDLSGIADWTPIGNGSGSFTGTYDGGGYTISGIKIQNGPQYAGLFGWVGNGGTLRNIGLLDAQIKSTNADYYAGSLVGYNSGTIDECFTKNPSVQATRGDIACGGLVGYNAGLVRNSYSLGGTARGDYGNYTGGLAGGNSGTVTQSYSTTRVSGSATQNGLIGAPSQVSYGTVEYCYFDKNAADRSGGPGNARTTAEMKQQATFSGWDFADIWTISEGDGYPTLKWESEWTVNDEIAATVNALTWNVIRGSNGQPGNVKVDLAALPAQGNRGTTIVWSVTAGQSYLTAAGKVTRPTASVGNQAVTLTATVSKEGGTTLTKEFILTVTVPYSLTYEPNGGSGTAVVDGGRAAGETFAAAASDTFTAPPGKAFKEWNTKDDAAGDSYPAGLSITMPAQNLTLYAVWEEPPLSVAAFALELPPGIKEGIPFNLTVRAVDKDGNTVTNYTGKITFSSSDPLASLP